MTINKTTTDLSTLKINYLTKEMYEDALENDEINENELYVTPGGEGGGGAIDATSIPTANKVAKFDTEARMNSEDMSSTEINNFVGNLGYTFNLIDMFYPVGSYYETSDTTFDPNITWGGTWVLETEGQVHVSSGTNYTVSGAGTNTTDGGAQTVTLTTNEIPSHCHVQRAGGYTYTDPNGQGESTSGGQPTWGGGYTGKSVQTLSTGGGQAHNNMPPYIVVNRWHRTA
jgi:hypothetical protein